VFALRPVSYDHPDAQELTERAQAYYVALYGGRDDDPLAAAEFAAPSGGFVVGYLDDAPAAMGGWTLTIGDPAHRVAKIRRMYVDVAVRRQGLAGAVLTHLETEAAGHGVTRIILATGRPQVEAIAFYRRHGYTDVPPFGYYAGSDQVVCLGKELGPAPQPTS
jgi:GNAT superfamily N-acetyltransferase